MQHPPPPALQKITLHRSPSHGNGECSALVLNNTGAWGVAAHAQPPTALPLHTRVCRFFSLWEGFSRPPLSTQKSPPVKDPTHIISAMGAPSRKWA